jgi:hypothetical protein
MPSACSSENPSSFSLCTNLSVSKWWSLNCRAVALKWRQESRAIVCPATTCAGGFHHRCVDCCWIAVVMGDGAHCPKVGEDLCRRASSAPSAAGLIVLVDLDSCGSIRRGNAVACIDKYAIVMLERDIAVSSNLSLLMLHAKTSRCYVIPEFRQPTRPWPITQSHALPDMTCNYSHCISCY